MNRETLERIIVSGTQAPSGDNSQPWSFSFDNEKLSVYAHPKKDHPILNVDNGGTLIAIGALLENISVASMYEGLTANITLSNAVNDTTPIAQIAFIPYESNDHVHKGELYAAIEERHTNRKVYVNKPIPSETLTLLSSLHEASANVTYITDKNAITTIAACASLMEKIAIETRELHKLFFADIFWNDKENDEGKEGLFIKTLELPPPVQQLFKLLPHWNILQALNKVHFSSLVAKTNASLYASSRAIGAIFTRNTLTTDYLNTGRLFERIWLHATAEGLCLQPIAGALYLIKYIQVHPDQKIISSKNVALLFESEKTIRQIFKKETVPLMMFRIGYAQAPSAISYRQSPIIEYTNT